MTSVFKRINIVKYIADFMSVCLDCTQDSVTCCQIIKHKLNLKGLTEYKFSIDLFVSMTKSNIHEKSNFTEFTKKKMIHCRESKPH